MPQTVTFPSSDGLPITADLYVQGEECPFAVLFHQARSSRGEYSEIAPRLMQLGMNCLAADLRSGGQVNSVRNETAARAAEKGLPTEYLDAEKDMLAAVEYVRKEHDQEKVVVLGSSYSASLVLRMAKSSSAVMAAVAFSPGEYMLPYVRLERELAGLGKPIFVTGTTSEYTPMKELLSKVPEKLITWYEPQEEPGVHGAKALWQSSPDSEPLWTALETFLKRATK